MARRTEDIAGRSRHVLFVVVAGLGLLAGRLTYMQVARAADYRRQADERMQLTRTLDPRRGAIVDRDGRDLVTNTLAYDVRAVPAKVTEEALARLAERLPDYDLAALTEALEGVKAEALAWMEDDLQRRFGRSSERRRRRARKSLTRYFLGRRSYVLVSDVRDRALIRELYVERADYAGLSVRARPVRRHPRGARAGHLIGYMGRVNAEEYGELRRRDYKPTDWLGRAGLEKVLETRLRGRRGSEIRGRRERAGRPVILFRDPPVDGQRVRLTLDLWLQRACEMALDARLAELAPMRERVRGETFGASAVLIDVRDGSVLAMASAPRYAPGRFRRDYPALRDDPDKPLFDRTRGGPRVPPPGSVFKILTAIAALEEGVAHAGEGHDCRGYLNRPGQFRCWIGEPGHGVVGLIGAIEQSCNIYFYKLGERLGGDKLGEWGRQFGFGQGTGIELTERHGTMPEPAWVAHHRGRTWQLADSRFVGIGQGLLETTPLQVARFIAGVATRGALPRIRLLADTPVERTRIEVSAGSWRTVLRGMEAVVDSGTASRYGLAEFGFAAKTGTAETGGQQETHAWLAGYAPRDEPQVALVVMFEHSGHGGEICGPVARQVLQAYFQRPEDAEEQLRAEAADHSEPK